MYIILFYSTRELISLENIPVQKVRNCMVLKESKLFEVKILIYTWGKINFITTIKQFNAIN